MKYRVIVKVEYTDVYFDFSTAMDAMVFMDAAVTNYQGSGDGKVKFKVSMQMIPENAEEEED